MIFFLIRRFLSALPSLLGIFTVVFFLTHLIPGDPVEKMLGERASFEEKQALRKHLQLDLPLSAQYWSFLKATASGDLGTSLVSKKPVAESIGNYFPATLELALGALLLSLLLGLPLGVASSINPLGRADRFCLGFSSLGVAVPSFVSAPLLIWVFALLIPLFPVGERGTLAHLFLPSLSLAIPLSSYIMRMTRTSMLMIINSDYIRTARSKSLSQNQIYFKHALRNASGPLITIVGLQLGALLTGLVITETIFDWPGLGSLLFNALGQRDYPTIQGCVLVVGIIYMLVNTLADIVYAWMDPKVRVF